MAKTMDITFRHTLPAVWVRKLVSAKEDKTYSSQAARRGGGVKYSPNADPTIKISIDIRSVLLEVRSGQRQKDTNYLPICHAK